MILYRWFSFVTRYSHSRWFFLETLGALLKNKRTILLRLWSFLYIAFSKQKMSWILFHDFHVTLVAQVQNLSSLEFLASPCKKHRYFLFVEHTVYVQSVLVLNCWFHLVTIFPNSICKRFHTGSSRWSAKEAMILLGYPEKWPEFC